MSYARTRLMLFMLPLLLAAGACADRAENAGGQAALDRQLSRAHRPDSSALASPDAPEPASSVARQEAMPAPEQRPTAVDGTSHSQPSMAKQPAAQAKPVEPAPAARRPAPAPDVSPSATPPTQPGTTAMDSATPAPVPVPTARSPRMVTMTVPIGAVLSVSLNQELSTQDNHVGDSFTTTLQEPFMVGSTVLLPAGAIIEGRVTAAQQSTRVGRTAVLKLAFDAVRFEGRSYPLDATVLEANPERRSRASTTETAGKIAAGAAAGALLGRILGKDTKSTVAGAAMGAAAGTAIALGTQDVDAVLPKDSRMVIRVDRPVAVEVEVR